MGERIVIHKLKKTSTGQVIVDARNFHFEVLGDLVSIVHYCVKICQKD